MDNPFLGRGWSFPPNFLLGGYEVAMVHDEEDVRQSLEILLATHLSERTLLSNYGCNLSNYLFSEVDQRLITKLTDAVTDAILQYEPRITLEKVEAEQQDGNSGVLLINIYYIIKSINSRFNMVYPFYLNETASI
jgi:uncharacterized protein